MITMIPMKITTTTKKTDNINNEENEDDGGNNNLPASPWTKQAPQ